MAETRVSELRKLEAIVKDHTDQMAEIRAQHTTLKQKSDQQLTEIRELKNLLKGSHAQQSEVRTRAVPNPLATLIRALFTKGMCNFRNFGERK